MTSDTGMAARGHFGEAPRRRRLRRWLLRPRVLVPLALLWLVFEAFWPDYQYVWFEADATVDGEPVRFTQLVECAYGRWWEWPGSLGGRSMQSDAAVGARLKGGAGIMIWHDNICKAPAYTWREPVSYIAGLSWVDDIREPTRMEFYPTLKSVTAEGSRVHLGEVRMRFGPSMRKLAFFYPAFWKDRLFSITWTLPYLAEPRRKRPFIGMLACVTPREEWMKFPEAARLLSRIDRPVKGMVFREMEALAGVGKGELDIGKFVNAVVASPREFLRDCTRGLPYREGVGWVFDGNPEELPLYVPAQPAETFRLNDKYPYLVTSYFGVPEHIDWMTGGFVATQFGRYSVFLPDTGTFIYTVPVWSLRTYRGFGFGG